MAAHDTVARILQSAQELFAEQGFTETSLRSITARAGVNLAAVNYHFGSKKKLIQAAFACYLTPFCEELTLKLDEIEAQNSDPSIEEILTLIGEIALRSGGVDVSNFMQMIGTAYVQGQGHVRHFLVSEYGPVFNRLVRFLWRSSPHMSATDFYWRVIFMLGSAAFTLSGAESHKAIVVDEYGEQTSNQEILQRLIPFVAAGLAAPVPIIKNPLDTKNKT